MSRRPSLLGSRCPVYNERLIRGRQTVCSGRCRAKRWRQTHATRHPEIRGALEAIAQLVQHTLGRLARESPMRAYVRIRFSRHSGAMVNDMIGFGVGPSRWLTRKREDLEAQREAGAGR